MVRGWEAGMTNYSGIWISSVIQHTVGIQGPSVILAILEDPRVALFQTPDLDLVLDFELIVPLLTEALNKGASFPKRGMV